MPNPNGRPCTVCSLPSAVRGPLEQAHLAGEAIAAVARDYARAGVSPSAVRRHLVGGHAERNTFRRSDVDDDLTLSDALEGASRGLRQLHAVRDDAYANRNTTNMIRAAAESTRVFESLNKLGTITEEKVTADLADLTNFRRAVVATAKRNTAATEAYAEAMAEGGNRQEHDVAEQLQKLVESVRTINTKEK